MNQPTSVSESDVFKTSIEDSNNWSITSKDLKVIPPYYPLDCTYKVIRFTTLENVTQRLIHCIKTYGIAIKWSQRDSSKLQCSTNDLLFFEINFWNNIDVKSNDPVPKWTKNESPPEIIEVIVEIRRHEGDCVRFHHLKNVLFGGLCQGEFLDSNEVCCYHTSHTGIKGPSLKQNVSRLVRPLTIHNLMDVMNSTAMAFELICNENTFDTIMGMQMLLFLTDATLVQRVYAAHVCDFILLGLDCIGNDVAAIPEVMRKFITTKGKLIEHHYALQILSNIFENNTYTQEIPFNIREGIDSWNSIIPSLIMDIQNIVINPHVAYNGLRCLRRWYLFAGSIADKGYIHKILECLDAIQTYGNQWYTSIEIEANQLKFTLDNNS